MPYVTAADCRKGLPKQLYIWLQDERVICNACGYSETSSTQVDACTRTGQLFTKTPLMLFLPPPTLVSPCSAESLSTLTHKILMQRPILAMQMQRHRQVVSPTLHCFPDHLIIPQDCLWHQSHTHGGQFGKKKTTHNSQQHNHKCTCYLFNSFISKLPQTVIFITS